MMNEKQYSGLFILHFINLVECEIQVSRLQGKLSNEMLGKAEHQLHAAVSFAPQEALAETGKVMYRATAFIRELRAHTTVRFDRQIRCATVRASRGCQAHLRGKDFGPLQELVARS